MNRTALGLMAVAGLMAFSSCTSDVTDEMSQSDNNMAVFTLEMPMALGSRAGSYGDGIMANITKIKYSVFKVDGEGDDASYTWMFDETKDYTAIGYGKEILNISLLKNVSYKIAFCAYSIVSPSGFATFNKGVITVDYTKNKVNHVEQDLFVGSSETFSVNGGHTEEINLSRPFAQVNWGASDVNSPALDDYRDNMTAQVKIAKDMLCSKYDVITGEKTAVESEDDFVELSTFNLNTIPDSSDVAFPVSIPYKSHSLVAMYFLLVPETAAGTMKMEFRGGVQDVDVEVNNAPLQANYRTNIYGDLLTTPGVFDLSLESAFGNTDESGNISDPTVIIEE